MLPLNDWDLTEILIAAEEARKDDTPPLDARGYPIPQALLDWANAPETNNAR